MKVIYNWIKFFFGLIFLLIYIPIFITLCVISMFGFSKLGEWCIKEFMFLESIMDEDLNHEKDEKSKSS